MRLRSVFISIIALLCMASPIHAQEKYTIDPAFQEVLLSNEQRSKTISLTLHNQTQKATTFEVFAVPFPDVEHFGSFQFVDFSDPSVRDTQPGYLSFDAQQFVLEPNASRAISVKISDRAEIRPGGTYVAIVSRVVTTPSVGTQPVIPALAAQLLIRKTTGETKNVSLTGVEGLPPFFSLRFPKNVEAIFNNNGNVHVLPRGSVRVTDMFNRVVGQGTVNESSLYVLPERERHIPTKIARSRFLIPISFLTFTLEGTAEDLSYGYQYSFLYISPWLLLVFAALSMLLIHKKKSSNHAKTANSENDS